MCNYYCNEEAYSITCEASTVTAVGWSTVFTEYGQVISKKCDFAITCRSFQIGPDFK